MRDVPILELGSRHLRPRDLAAAARNGATVALSAAAWDRIAASHDALLRLAAQPGAIYGVNTGLGAVADTRIAPGDDDAQRRVVLARMVGVGPIAVPEQVRAVMLARLARFAVGCSGVSPAMVAAYIAMPNAGLLPVMPLLGSIGEADLAPLAHVAAVLAGDGEAVIGNERLPGAVALARAGILAPRFATKDGLALVSSNAVSVGLGALVLTDVETLFGAWLAAAALSFEAYRANVAPLHPQACALRPAPGQSEIASALLAILPDSALSRPGSARRLQDPLSFRCVAPVLGACLSSLRSATDAIALELTSSDDNPAILAASDTVQPNANFDTTHLALAFETLGLAMARVAAAQGARILQLMSAGSSGLPRFLSPLQAGRSGLAAVQKTVVSLVAEIGHGALPMPASVMPAADGIEDYATMAVSIVRKTAALLRQMRLLCAVELLVAAQACDLRDDFALGSQTASIQAAIRARVSTLRDDRPSAPDIAAVDALIGGGAFDHVAAELWRETADPAHEPDLR